jgi:hypothetical protein
MPVGAMPHPDSTSQDLLIFLILSLRLARDIPSILAA